MDLQARRPSQSGLGRIWTFAAITLAGGQHCVQGQSTPEQLTPILSGQIQSPRIAEYQLQHYLMRRVPTLPAASSAQQWLETAARLRKHVLEDVLFHGWPAEWVTAPLKCEVVARQRQGDGNRIIRLR